MVRLGIREHGVGNSEDAICAATLETTSEIRGVTMPLLKQFLCLVRHPMEGHQYVRVFSEDKREVYEVCLCGARTPGWTYGESPANVPGSQPYWDRIHDEMWEMELAHHGGG